MSELDAKYYFAQYPHQLNLVFLWDLLFNIIRIISTVIIKLLNAFANTLSLFAIYLITDYLGKKEKKSNNPLAIILFCGLVVIPMLSNFVYGDEVGITLALFSVYFIMKYSLEEKRKYLIYSAILMSLGCMVRMNNLIVVIAILIYLIFSHTSNSQ